MATDPAAGWIRHSTMTIDTTASCQKGNGYSSGSSILSKISHQAYKIHRTVGPPVPEKKLEKVYFKSQILVHEYWTRPTRPFLCSSIVSFWITLACSKECKDHIFGQYWYTKNVPVLTNTGTFQYLGPEVYFFQKMDPTENVHN